MSGVQIKTRKTSAGDKRYLVYYRRGGRTFKMQYAGSFEKKREAETRRDLVAGELAAGRDPKILLAALLRPESRVGLMQRWLEFEASRIDVGESALGLYRNARVRYVPLLGVKTDPAAITVDQIQAAVGELVEPSDKTLPALKPNTIVHYTSTLRQVFDFCDVVPNPASSRKLRLPSAAHEDLAPPTNGEWLTIQAHLADRSQLVLELVECLGLRISEATQLEHGDIDYGLGRVRISRARTKSAAGQRWLPVPDELLGRIEEARMPGKRQVFHGLSNDNVRYDLGKACKAGKVAAHGPHDLRHRRISLWIRLQIDAVTVQTWAGHAKASMSLDTYGHVVIDPRGDRWAPFWRDVYANSRSPREAPVGHVESESAVS